MCSLFSVLLFVNTILVSKINGHLLVDKLRLDFFKLEEDLWKYVLNPHEHSNATDSRAAVLSVFEKYDKDLQKIPQDIIYGMNIVRQSPSFLFLYSDLRIINILYNKFRSILTNSNSEKNISAIDQGGVKISHVIEEVLYDPKNNVNKTMENIFQQVFLDNNDGEKNESLLSHISKIVLERDYMCNHHKESPQQVFYNLYNALALTHLKGYIMIQFSYMTQKLVQEGNYSDDALSVRKQFEKTTKIMSSLGLIMGILGTKMWRCDPKEHIKGSTYEELTALIQGHVENEADMNERGTCRQNCVAYPYAKSYGCYDSESSYCQKRKSCSGKIISCQFIDSHMTACISPLNSFRRYEYIQYEQGALLGKKELCHSKNIHSWYRWFVQCSYCLCLCDQEGPHSDRYFNLRPALSDVANNRVVTGLRIIKHNRIIHLQIQEGKLLPYGYIDASTVRWVPVDNYKITDEGVQNGADFHTMNYTQKSMFIDNLTPREDNHTITGVRFEFIDNHLRFAINVRKFDFESGVISNESYYVHGNDTSSRVKFYSENPDIPTASPPSKPQFQAGYVEFTHSSFEKDVAQTTVPFFDTQPVAAEPPVPLKGAGIYYKGRDGYGGFVAPTIEILEFSKYMNIELPKTPLEDNVFSIFT